MLILSIQSKKVKRYKNMKSLKFKVLSGIKIN